MYLGSLPCFVPLDGAALYADRVAKVFRDMRAESRAATRREKVLPVPRAKAVLSRPADAECPDLRVWPAADVLAIFRFHADDEVDFDVDLRELQRQDRLDVFCGFLREIGRRLGKPVLMDSEGDCGHPVLGFDVEADQVVLLAGLQVR
ncbi:hypothetical protein OG379_40765 (plasmid) [Streptomyces sp. NBC_01166]|uniref:hypothetical protein n=1 Tax=Streptomyces sp. NBC_01166 TaxID=2903755 RepID=UPI002F91BEFD|nr:hypothetical protein OG379_40765 [Streptomyces sp. NBC_01166]